MAAYVPSPVARRSSSRVRHDYVHDPFDAAVVLFEREPCLYRSSFPRPKCYRTRRQASRRNCMEVSGDIKAAVLDIGQQRTTARVADRNIKQAGRSRLHVQDESSCVSDDARP